MSQMSVELRQKKAALIEEARKVLSSTMTPESRAKYDAMVADVKTMNEDIERMERQDAMDAALNASVRSEQRGPLSDADDKSESAQKEARKLSAFWNYAKRGNRALNAEEQRALGESVASAGGYTVPTLFDKDIQTALLAYGDIINKVHQFDTTDGAPIQLPMANDTATLAVEIAENPTSNPEQDVAFQQLTFTPVELTSGQVLVSNQLLEDAAFDLQGYLSKLFAIRYMRGLTNKFTNGSVDGTSIQGVVSAVTQKVTITTQGTLQYKDIVNIFTGLDPAYVGLPSCGWSFNQNTYGQLLGIVDNEARPILVSSVSAGAPDRLFGKPVALNQYLPNVAASTATLGATNSPIMFGDWSSYWLRNAGKQRFVRLVERYGELNQTAFILFRRVAGKYVNAGTNPIIAFKG
ncbi:MAG TPA: phage major capsid protein [Acidobacteriaceae bacterium]|nr:phage major capsid protein [Acidobacteriaceae bacterium]